MVEATLSKRTEKLQLMLNDEELRAIDDWRFKHRLPSRAAALRELLRRRLGADAFNDPPTALATGPFSVVEPGER